LPETPESAERPRLTERQVVAEGGWHPRYARVLAIATDGDYGFALVDGNGDGAELEEELWEWHDGRWDGRSSSGGGGLDWLEPLRVWWPYRDPDVCVAFGRAPRRESVTLRFARDRRQVPVSADGVWAFVLAQPGLHAGGDPVLADER